MLMVWEERWHPLREEWVVVAAHRQNRPWNGETVEREESTLPDYLPECYLCPGNTRVSGKRNDNYKDVFKTIETEARVSGRHLAETGRILFQDVLKAEREDGRRIIFENESAIVFLPYFARYAYEAFVAPKASHPSIATLSEAELRDFAEALKRLLVKFDNLWRTPFPYVMPLHQAPTDGDDHRGFHFHIEFHPPLRRPNLLKYLAGPEIGGGNFL